VSFHELVTAVRTAVSSRAVVVPVPAVLLPGLSWMVGLLLRDRLLTREEYRAMAAGLADSDGPATGDIRLTDWLAAHGPELGRHYANELDRHFRTHRTPRPAT
jgi:NADH dehydrogenase